MRIDLPLAWVLVLNVAGWPVIHMVLSWSFTRMPQAWFKAPAPSDWEMEGRFYERVFAVKQWKERLPDAAAWFVGGFPKGKLHSASTIYFERFKLETWRGELCHWATLACAPIFFVWNPWWTDLLMVAYAIGANVPCIIVQRYNRARLHVLLRRRCTAL